jgi:hypothetical protein
MREITVRKLRRKEKNWCFIRMKNKGNKKLAKEKWISSKTIGIWYMKHML